MGISVLDGVIDRVAIIDDSNEARKSYSYAVRDAHLDAVDQPGPLPPLDEFRERLTTQADAALCDYHITVTDYATFDGAQLVAEATKTRFTAVLCTRWERAHLERIRPFRRWIPVLIRPEE